MKTYTHRPTATVQIAHDAFAREGLYRRRVSAWNLRSCTWCGARPGRFVYAVYPDSGMGKPHFNYDKPFCSVGCWRAYH